MAIKNWKEIKNYMDNLKDDKEEWKKVRKYTEETPVSPELRLYLSNGVGWLSGMYKSPKNPNVTFQIDPATGDLEHLVLEGGRYDNFSETRKWINLLLSLEQEISSYLIKMMKSIDKSKSKDSLKWKSM